MIQNGATRFTPDPNARISITWLRRDTQQAWGAVLQAAIIVEGRMQGTSGTFLYPASSAVGFIEKVVTEKELIDNIIKGVDEILTEMTKRL